MTLSDLVRETLAERSESAPEGAALLESVRHGIKRSRRRRALGTSATALALVGVIVATGLSLSHNPGRPSEIALGGRAVPPGMQAVSYRGVEVLVPADWQLDATRCATPAQNTVLSDFPRPALACANPQPPGLTVVRFESVGSPNAEGAERLAVHEVDLDGHKALRGAGTLPSLKQPVAVLSVPSQHVVVTVEAPKQELAERILDSAQVVSVDAAGCSTRAPADVIHLSGEEGTLVPREPERGAVCRYVAGWLVRSTVLPVEQLNLLRAQLNGLLAKTSLTVDASCAIPPVNETFVVRLDIGMDRPLDVEIRDRCGDVYATRSGLFRQGQKELVEKLASLTGGRTVR